MKTYFSEFKDPFNIVVILLAISVFFFLKPYFIWGEYNYGAFLIIFALSIWSILSFHFNIVINKSDVLFCLFSSLVFLYLIRPGFQNGGNYVGYLVTFAGMLLFFILDAHHKKRCFELFALLFSLSLIPGIILVGIGAMGMPIDFFYIGPINDESVPNQEKIIKGIYYFEYFGSIVLSNSVIITESGRTIFRLCGMYDEPGVVGTISGLILVASGFELRGNIKNNILFVAGILSMSMAFFAVWLLFLFMTNRYRVYIPLLFVGLVIIQYSELINPVLYHATMGRFEIVERGFKGINREPLEMAILYQEHIKSDIISLLFGSNINYPPTGMSWKLLIMYKGIFGLFILCAFLGLYAVRKIKTYLAFVFILIFMLSIYQRPLVWNLVYMFIFICGIEKANTAGLLLPNKSLKMP